MPNVADPIFGKAPAGTNLSESKAVGNDAAVIVLMSIATAAVAARLWARYIQRIGLQADDYLVVLSLLFVYGTGALSIAGGAFGAGMHVWTASSDEILVVIKMLFAYTWVYSVANTFCKLSVISFYHRVFGGGDRTFNGFLYFAAFLAIAYPIAVICTTLSSCRPLSYLWLEYTDPTAKGECINVNEFFLITGVINMVIDVFILSIPIPKIYKLQMDKRKKMTVVGIMMLGGFVCVASIVRIYYLVVLQTTVDLTWIMGPVFIWSCVEPSVGILSACLPVLGPLLRATWRNVVSSESRGGGDRMSKRFSKPFSQRKAGDSSNSGWRNIGSANGAPPDLVTIGGSAGGKRVSKVLKVSSMSTKTLGDGDSDDLELRLSGQSGGEWRELGPLSPLSTFKGRLRPDDDEVRLTNQVVAGGWKNGMAPPGRKGIMVQTHVDQVSEGRSSRSMER